MCVNSLLSCLGAANLATSYHRACRDYCPEEGFEYQGLRPTLSINTAQMIEAMSPTPEVRLVRSGSSNPCL
jgi:hypothetical protein